MHIPFNSFSSSSSSSQQAPRIFISIKNRHLNVKRKHVGGDDDDHGDSNDKQKKKKAFKIPYINTEGFKVATYTGRRSTIPDAFVIPEGQPFAGRMNGGSGRASIFGTRTYGSGYPNDTGRGTSGRGLPFFFWPIAWVTDKSGPGFDYLNTNNEYGDPSNSTRLGGPMMAATFTLFNTTLPTAITFRVLSDNITTVALLDAIMSNCSLSSTSPDFITSPAAPYNNSTTSLPRPESVIQYYRASSIALALDGYNNTAIHFPFPGVFDTSLPEFDGRATDMLSCINETIGRAAPLVTGVNNGPQQTQTGSPVTTVVAVISSLFGTCLLVAVLIRVVSLRRRRANSGRY